MDASLFVAVPPVQHMALCSAEQPLCLFFHGYVCRGLLCLMQTFVKRPQRDGLHVFRLCTGCMRSQGGDLIYLVVKNIGVGHQFKAFVVLHPPSRPHRGQWQEGARTRR